MKKIKDKLDPNWITGFIDAEGCFYVSLSRRKNSKDSWRVQACFQIMLHIKDKDLLLNIKSFFSEIGDVSYSKNVAIYRVQKLHDIINIIIPHFNKYLLITQKQSDFILFKDIVYLINNKAHMNKEGLIKILSLKASLNKGLSDSLIAFFPNIIKVERYKINIAKHIDYNWLAGFVSGEGYFRINIYKSKTCNANYAIKLEISIVQHTKDEVLINSIKNVFNCGYTYKYSNKNIIYLRISKFEDIYYKFIPLFKKYNIKGVKALDFNDFCEAAELINTKNHLTLTGFNKIQEIKSKMNRARYKPIQYDIK